MKILHIANEVVDTGNGIANAAVDLACSEAELGHDVSFISSGGAYVKLLADYHVHHYEIRQKPSRMAELAIRYSTTEVDRTRAFNPTLSMRT